MGLGRVRRLAHWFVGHFPERHLYVRSGGEMRGYALSTNRQLSIAAAVAVVAVWLGISTSAMLVGAMTQSSGEAMAAQTQAKYERWIADRQARLNSAVAQLSASSSSVEDLASSMERRHAAVAMLLTGVAAAPGAV